MIHTLDRNNLTFPHPAITDKEGVLAVFGDLSPQRLILGYRFGIFPWYDEECYYFWWFTHPRCILFPNRIKVSSSMRTIFNTKDWRFSINEDFESVISACSSVERREQEGTWIHSELKTAFIKLNELGYAHSVEAWDGDKLIGGLYGLAIGKVFFGESMFAKESNASKWAFIKLVKILEENGFEMIDCQQQTQHLMSLGAEMVSGEVFLKYLRKNNLYCLKESDLWSPEQISGD